MKVLLSWLREFAPFEGDPVELGNQMSDLGMAVESIEHTGAAFDGVIVARVLELRAHPDADRIQLVDVDTGDGNALQIVCGAKNLSVGDLVPLAAIGAVLPGDFRIEKRKMRGEVSNGMLCSSRELGLGDDHAGIMVLNSLAPAPALGTDARDALGLVDDVLFDLEINPNRPDAMSVAGVARDLAARLGLPFTIPEPTVVAASAASIDGRASVELVDPALCGRFHVRILDGVTVGESPDWMARRLTLCGMRPINSVVDASNYVMLELGQPNHTYDLAKVPGGALRVRWARDGEAIVTLDGVERTLATGDGVIADRDDRAIGIAGVMGGASTEISDATTSVLLEMAWWDPMTIARSSARLGLRSEASMRFERGADPDMVALAARRFAELLAPSGATLADGHLDAHGELPSREPVRVRTSRVNAYLGTDLDGARIVELLEPIGFRVSAVDDHHDAHDVVVASFRPDTRTEVDIIEEVARHHSYARIAPRVPGGHRTGGLTERQSNRRLLRQTLVGLGISEAMPIPFLAPGDLERAGLDAAAVSVTNPLVTEESVLRTSLRPGLVKALAYNESHRNTGVELFEVGKVFLPPPAGQQLPDEREHLGVAIAGVDGRGAVEVWHVMARALGYPVGRLDQRPIAGLHPTRSAQLVIDGVVVGALGEVDPEVSTSFGVAERIGWLEVDLDTLFAIERTERRYVPISRFPSSDVDLAFEVPDTVAAADVAQALRDAGGPLLAGVAMFDVYRGPGVAEGHRSLAYSLRFQATDRTLTDVEVGEARAAAIRAVESTLPVRLRG
jgi:phenylalanyl-tRNA synthetase beta chain